jgi:DNA-binding NtrC family response regulator
MFGHARGAFTDAHRDQKGLIALAEGGTVFLDEVDSLSPSAQSKLLRFLQEHTYRPIGSDRFVRANINVVAATNRDLEALVRERKFRADLFFRLNVLRLLLIPLRERRDDIALLARHFLAVLSTETETPRKSLALATIHRLKHHDWPGNVRELYNVIQSATVFSEGTQILPSDILRVAPNSQSGVQGAGFREARTQAIEAFERRYVEDVLLDAGGNVTRAARVAQKDRRAFGRLIKRYNINRDPL